MFYFIVVSLSPSFPETDGKEDMATTGADFTPLVPPENLPGQEEIPVGGLGTTGCSRCHCLEQFPHEPFHGPVTVTAAGPGHHSSALKVSLKAQSHLPDTKCPWAASPCAGEWPWALFSVLLSRAPFISPILFLEDDTPNRLSPV